MWYTPRDEPGYNRVGRASWYGELFHGRRTANGEIYDMDRLSAASPTLPLPVYAQVTNLTNGRSIVVRVNDRGPYANDRIMDLSRRSAEVLGFQSDGTALVRVKYLGRAPLNGDDRYEQKFLASQGWMRVAAKGRSGKGKPQAAAEVASLPPENPENLQTPWKDAAPVQSAGATPAPAQPNAAASYGWTMVSPPKEAEAAPFDAPLYWQASPRVAERPQVAATGSLPQAGKQSGRTGGFLIQAGPFKSRENADKARAVLAPVAPVELAEVATGGNVYFRVRVGPFPDDTAAEAALVKVTQAGYQGAKIIAKN
jgi:rare lipoprotein A